MRSAVPMLIEFGRAQAKIGGEVDHPGSKRSIALDALRRSPMRQAEKEQVAGCQVIGTTVTQQRNTAQIRVSAGNILPRVAAGRDLRDLYLRMKEQDTQQLARGITGPAYNRDSNSAHQSPSSQIE